LEKFIKFHRTINIEFICIKINICIILFDRQFPFTSQLLSVLISFGGTRTLGILAPFPRFLMDIMTTLSRQTIRQLMHLLWLLCPSVWIYICASISIATLTPRNHKRAVPWSGFCIRNCDYNCRTVTALNVSSVRTSRTLHAMQLKHLATENANLLPCFRPTAFGVVIFISA